MSPASAPAVAGPPFAGAIVLEVLGDPVPQGSKQAYVVKGRAIVTERGRATLGPWRNQIGALAAASFVEPIAGPVRLELSFTLGRPKSHYRTGARAGELLPAAPTWHATRPDVDKLARAVLDALSGVAYRDDGQVAELDACKTFGARPGVRITIVRLEAPR